MPSSSSATVGVPADEVLDELKNTHDETVKKLKTMDFQNLMKPLKSDDLPKRRWSLIWCSETHRSILQNTELYRTRSESE